MKRFSFSIQGKVYSYVSVKKMWQYINYYESKGLYVDAHSIKILIK